MKKVVLPGLLFGVAMAIGFMTVRHSWDGLSYYNIANISYQRDPAAIRQSFDFSHLEGEAFQFASRARLLEGASLVKADQGYGVRLGHFLVGGSDGTKRFACHVYDKVVLEFVGEGVLVNGEPTTLEVQADCRVSRSDANHIDTIFVPFGDLLFEEAKDGEFTFFGEGSVHVKVKNLFGEWPNKWALSTIRLLDSKDLDEVRVSTKEIPKERAQLFQFSVTK